MTKIYSSGVAFIFEGDTEQTFYEILISQFSGKHPEYSYTVNFDDAVNEVISESSCESHSVIIRMNSVKTISQIAHSADWFFVPEVQGSKKKVSYFVGAQSTHFDVTIPEGSQPKLEKRKKVAERCILNED